MIERCVTSWGYRNGQCAIWLDGETLCDESAGHYPDKPHRGHAPSGQRGADGLWGWVEYIEVDGELELAASNMSGHRA